VHGSLEVAVDDAPAPAPTHRHRCQGDPLVVRGVEVPRENADRQAASTKSRVSGLGCAGRRAENGGRCARTQLRRRPSSTRAARRRGRRDGRESPSSRWWRRSRPAPSPVGRPRDARRARPAERCCSPSRARSRRASRTPPGCGRGACGRARPPRGAGRSSTGPRSVGPRARSRRSRRRR
jgi:hypothetical protein